MKLDTAERHDSIARQLISLILGAHGDVRVESLYREVGASETVCREAFLNLTGESVDGFAKRIRLERAASLLTKSNCPVWEAAVDSGYSTDSTLDRAFRSHFGCSPSAFRELNTEMVEFPSFAYEQGFEPGRERVGIGVYTGFAQITTFTYDAFRLVERVTPDGLTDNIHSRSGRAISSAILGERREENR